MTHKTLDALSYVYLAEITARAFRSNEPIYRTLCDEGLLERAADKTITGGCFPPVTVRGFKLTRAGQLMLSESGRAAPLPR